MATKTKTKTEQLYDLTLEVKNLAGHVFVEYVNGHGYYLRDVKTPHTGIAWFKTFAVGVAWLTEYRDTGKPNWAELRAGRSSYNLRK